MLVLLLFLISFRQCISYACKRKVVPTALLSVGHHLLRAAREGDWETREIK